MAEIRASVLGICASQFGPDGHLHLDQVIDSYAGEVLEDEEYDE